MIICKKCNQFYIGMTANAVRNRLNQHRAATAHRKPTSVAKHFSAQDHSCSDMQFALLENHISISRRTLQVKEATWIHLFSATTAGINLKDETETTLDPNTVQIIKHFRHNMACTPYITSHIEEVGQNNLKYAKRPKI